MRSQPMPWTRAKMESEKQIRELEEAKQSSGETSSSDTVCGENIGSVLIILLYDLIIFWHSF